ncbi:MAG: hypothetical protein M0P49_02405, partial [Bacilli bacterium]|nr:hypothetical protein [Bacilli bacterium]
IDIDPILDYSIFNVEITPEDLVSDNSLLNVEPELVPSQVDEIIVDPVPNDSTPNVEPNKPKGNFTTNGSKKNH